MSNPFSDFSKKKEYLVCIDSDGCAIDSMDIKHIRCFGPCMITEWGLDAHREEILKRWNQVNLYSMTRGINRFKGLAAALEEADRLYAKIEDVQTFVKWTEDSDELSNAALQQAIGETGSICMKKALNWSREVNKAITELPKEDIRPFEHVQDVIRRLHETCDIAIVSSANYEAVKEEWTRFGLLTYVDVLLAQNAGSKKSCIERLLTYGYAKEHVLMTGDAPGDMDAAQSNGVLYYPILVSHESESWEQLEAAVEKVKNNTFQGEYQAGLIQQFVDNLTRP